MMAALFCMLFITSCQKDDLVSPNNNPADRGGITDPIDPITGLMIPLAGNGYITKAASGGTEAITSTGLSNWTNTNAISSTFFHVSNSGQLVLAFRASVPAGVSSIKAVVNGQVYTINNVSGTAYRNYRIGLYTATRAGYIKVDLQGISNTSGGVFANVSDIVVFGSMPTSMISFANNTSTYDAARKGANIRLQYSVGAAPEWFYNEMIVPVSSDKAGTNFISNGFDAGYAGVQITAANEKRVMFFVANPPMGTGAAKVVALGAGVTEQTLPEGKFMTMPYNWSSASSYKFLTRATSDGSGGMNYSTWFYSPSESQWKFVATCNQPNTSNKLTGLYSGLQCINTENTFQVRRVSCINQWSNNNGTWSEVTSATFAGDAIANTKQRLDYTASTDHYAFSMNNAGFAYDNNLPLNSSLTRMPTSTTPTVDLTNLPN